MKPLLTYALTTDPDPPQASPKSGKPRQLALTFVVSPPDQGTVYCDQITFHFDIGPEDSTDSTYLTSVGTGILTVPPNPSDAAESEWDLDKAHSGNGTFSFMRTAKNKEVADQGYVFKIYGIYVSRVVGTAKLMVTENSSKDGTTYTPRQATYGIPKFPTTFGSVVFEADTTSLNPGNTGTSLHWEGDDTATYALARDGVAVKGPVKSPWPTGPLTEDTIFTLTVGYSAGDVAVKRNYYIPILVRNPVVSLMGPKDPVRVGEPVTLTWHSEGVAHCTIEGPGLARKNVDRLKEFIVKPKRVGDLEYRLRGTTASGSTVESEFTATALPKAPKADAQLVLVKTSGNKDGKVAIRIADGAGRFQKGPADLATGWAEADAAGGTPVIVPYVIKNRVPLPDLVLIEPTEAEGGWVHLHACFAPQHGQGDEMNLRTAFDTRWAPDGTWFMAPMGQMIPGDLPRLRQPDLIFVRTKNTRNGRNVEVHYATFFRAFPEVLGPLISPFLVANASKGKWLLGYIGTGPESQPDLVFVQTAGTATGKVELSYATGSSNYSALGAEKPIETGFNTKQAANGSFHLADMTGDGKPDLVFVKTAKTRSKRVELYWAEAAKGYKKPVGGFTRFDVGQGPTGTWCVLGVGAPKFPLTPAVVVEPVPDPTPVRPDPRDRFPARRVGPRGAME